MGKREHLGKREPAGRLSRSTREKIQACSPAEVKRLRDAAVAGMRGEEWGTQLGRLFLEGKIEPPLFEAGKRWARLAARRRIIDGSPDYPTQESFIGRSAGHAADPDSDAGKVVVLSEVDTIREFKEAHQALCDGGLLSEQAVVWVCERDKAPESQAHFMNLESGLNRLCHLWGLTQDAGNGRRRK